MGKVIAIAFADLHLHRFKQHNKPNMSRLDWGLKVLKDICTACKAYNVPCLFAGDLLHNPKEVENIVITRLMNTYEATFEKEGIKFYAISGNHDMSEKNTWDHESPSYLNGFEHFKTFKSLDYAGDGFRISNGIKVYGVPYMNYDQDMVRMIREIAKHRKKTGEINKAILLLHSDFPGAKTPEGYEIAGTEYINSDLDIFFKRWDLVLCGHIHKQQRLGKKAHMLGPPLQLDRGQMGEKCGYWLVYDNLRIKFVELKDYPKFIYLKPGESPTNDNDFFIDMPQADKEDQEASKTEFLLSNSRNRLAKNYCRLKGIKNKAKKQALISVLNSVE